MKRFLLILILSILWLTEAFAYKTYIGTECVGFKKYNYWKIQSTGATIKDYVGLCDQGPFGFIASLNSNPVLVAFILLILLVLLLKYTSKKKTPEKIKKEKKVKEHKEQEKKRIEASEPGSSDISARLKKLRQMYKDGILSKVEFEKAKNKLLK